MICLRSGYCCINFDVLIVNDAELGISEDNIIHKPYGVKCKHLEFDKNNVASCLVHDKEWYKDTPCFEFTQIEYSNSNCRLGEFFIKKENEQ